jgi:hypothetical protein
MNYIYKFFYIIFLYYLNFKDGIAWISSMFVMILCSSFLTIGTLGAFDLFSPFLDLLSFPGTHRKIAMLISTFILIGVYWLVFSYILLNKLKVSKIDGTRPDYEFVPTRKTKIIVVCFLAFFILYPFLVKGIIVFLLN